MSSCVHIGGPVVKATPKTLTWECSMCGRRRRERRDSVYVIDLRRGDDAVREGV